MWVSIPGTRDYDLPISGTWPSVLGWVAEGMPGSEPFLHASVKVRAQGQLQGISAAGPHGQGGGVQLFVFTRCDFFFSSRVQMGQRRHSRNNLE